MASSSVSGSACANIAVGEVVDTSFFLQMIPCTDESGLRQAIWRSGKKVSKSGNDDLAFITLAGGQYLRGARLQPRSKLTLSARLEKSLRESMQAFRADPWAYTGRAFGECTWSVGITYRQTWTRKELKRGRLVASVPLGLYPASREISIRTWETTRSKSTSTDAMEEARTTEISGSEKLSTAVKKQLLHETNSTYNPSATINNISIPTQAGAPVSLGGNLGVSAMSGTLNRDTVESGSDFVQDATFKAIESVKTARTVTVETSTEGGFDSTARETLANPNRVNTLTYLYYELVEGVEIATRPERLDLYLNIPLPMNHAITREWLLTNECFLRPLVQCDRLVEGFDAARRLIALDKLEAARRAAEPEVGNAPAAGGGGAQADPNLETVVKKVDRALEAYRKLSGATQGRLVGGWIYWELVKAVSENIVDAFDRLETRWSASGFRKTNRDDVAGAVDTFNADIGDIDMEFGKVNAAVAMFAVGGFVAMNAVPFGAIAYAAVLAVVAACELAGLDLAPDDMGLERRAEEMTNARKALIEAAVVATPPAAPGAPATPDPTLEAERIAAKLRLEQEQSERAEMETLFEALQRHIRDRRHFFHRAIWSTFDHSWIAERLRQLGLQPALFELRFHAFDGEYGAVRLVNEALATKLGFDARSLDAWRAVAVDVAQAPRVDSLTVPAPGVIVEPYLGDCDGGDAFVSGHRKIDLERAAAERDKAAAQAAYAQGEADRLAKRLAAGDLSDPRPLAGVTSVELENLSGATTSGTPGGGT